MVRSRGTVDPTDQQRCAPHVTWTLGNVAEAFPGVCTPLGFTFMHEPVELALRRAFFDIGVFTRRDQHVPEDVEEQFWTCFAGRAAANVDSFRKLADLVPGTSASAVEQQLFGYVRPGVVDHNSRRRYPAIALRAPATLLRLPHRHDAMFSTLRAWRRSSLSAVPHLDSAGCRDLIRDARERFHQVMKLHFLVSFASAGLAEKLLGLATGAGRSDLCGALLSGVRSDEVEIAADLWDLASGRLAMAEFLDRHGYHGHEEGQLHSPTWREEPDQISERLATYRSLMDRGTLSPVERLEHQLAARHVAAEAFAGAISPTRRRFVPALTSLTARFLALREQGKAGYLITFDVARSAVRRLGGLLAESGKLSVEHQRTNGLPEPTFFCTYTELLDEYFSVEPDLIAERQNRYLQHCRQQLPRVWTGVPAVEPAEDELSRQSFEDCPKLTGVAASGGSAEGTALVVLDPAVTKPRPGDVLVCRATDPSWVSLMLMASAVVTDLGGMLSHGAIVARELGIPCVSGTGDATRLIRTGQHLRVDGDRGWVEIIKQAPPSQATRLFPGPAQ